MTQYAASKAGVIAITKGDAQAYAAEGIRVSACSVTSAQFYTHIIPTDQLHLPWGGDDANEQVKYSCRGRFLGHAIRNTCW
jgi:NAD(P)-dependent dehydrogenase (short-subunit alcohol dehydrogenase family)